GVWLGGAVVEAGVRRQMTALEQLGRFVAQCGHDAASADVRELVELHVIDAVGAWFATVTTAEAARLYMLDQSLRNGKDPSISLKIAIRCAMARLSEVDDIHLPSMTTPGGIVIPATLTMATAMKSPTAEDLMSAA